MHFAGRSREFPSVVSRCQRTLNVVSTRRLILASLLCGIAILVAGGLKLFQTTADGNRVDAVLLGVGEAASVAGVDVSVTEVSRTDRATLVSVRAGLSNAATDAAPTDLASGWRMLVDGALTAPVDAVTNSGEACGLLPTNGTVTCILEFGVANGTPTFIYSRDGSQAQWLAGT